MELYTFPNKKYRAQAIKRYMEDAGWDACVCFSCGNASRALREAGVDVLDISPSGDLDARRWFTMAEIRRLFPNRFDATSGHLPTDCLLYVADEYRRELKTLPEEIYLPTGSGETLVALKMAFTRTKIHAVYNLSEGTKFEPDAPLNSLVKALAGSVTYASDN